MSFFYTVFSYLNYVLFLPSKWTLSQNRSKVHFYSFLKNDKTRKMQVHENYKNPEKRIIEKAV